MPVSWDTALELAQHAKTLALFGGAAIKNTQVNAGGIGAHSARQQLMELKDSGIEIVNISPIATKEGVELPDFDTFWNGEQFYVGDQNSPWT